MWQVTLQKKGLGERKNLYGPYRLCLTDRALSLIKLGVEDTTDRLEFPVSQYKQVQHSFVAFTHYKKKKREKKIKMN